MLSEQALRALDILVVNEAEGVWLGTALGGTDGDALSLHEMLGIIVIRTLGGEGVEWADGGQCYHRPAPPTQVRDTTAAGDCFVGVLAAALDRGATLAEAVTRAVTAASRVKRTYRPFSAIGRSRHPPNICSANRCRGRLFGIRSDQSPIPGSITTIQHRSRRKMTKSSLGAR
jgi:sugar/nucleoside kinase (ribokinase family)